MKEEYQDNREDFTRENYAKILKKVTELYNVVNVGDWDDNDKTAIWRHDVDYSPQSALKLSKIETNLGVKATYFFNLRTDFYNLLEPAVSSIVREISIQGHEVGLHFDANLYGVSTEKSLINALEIERNAFEAFFGIRLKSFSFHNPNDRVAEFRKDRYAELTNAYSDSLMTRFKYCSDSNGFWRFLSLENFVDSRFQKIYVLTHPGWWQDLPMSPRGRIARCVEGRARATLAAYDAQLEKDGRKNFR